MLGKLKSIYDFFDANTKEVQKTKALVKKINNLEDEIKKLSNEELKEKTTEFSERLKKGETTDDILVEAFAVVREASRRYTGLRHYDVQLIGGILMHNGNIVEMKTGEGKTLVATLPLYLNALERKGAHLVTVNDYLARRDAVWVGQIFSRLGLSIGVINSNETSYLYDASHVNDENLDKKRDEEGFHKVKYEYLKPSSRKEAYQADITYGTNSEFGFDYLRDHITQKPEDLRQRDLNYAIIDEVDSVLIDEARVPLIISSPTSVNKENYKVFTQIAKNLKEGEDYEVEKKHNSVKIKKEGIEKAEKMLNISNLYEAQNVAAVDLLETALKAKSLYIKDKDYVVKDGQIVIIDEFTGRMQEGRRWSDGLHQAIEAKENLEVQDESRTYASITYKNYFKMYKKISGMTGTAETSKEEFFKVYGLDVVVVPTNKPVIRDDRVDLIFPTEEGKFKAIAKKVKELQDKGQPVLIGTASVEKSELLSKFLVKEGISHTLLNAKNHEMEGEIIADAGKAGHVTVATNMAGRGVDIKLGGPNADEMDRKEILDLGGLYVIGTERHTSRRIDNQLRGRSGRQGDPGVSQFYVSLDDDLIKFFGNREFLKSLLLKKQELEGEDKPISLAVVSRGIEKAQKTVEGIHFDSRKHVMEYDDVLDIQRKAVYAKRQRILKANHQELDKILEEDFAENSEQYQKILEKKNELGEEDFYTLIKKVYLENIDKMWMDHLNLMDHLRSSVSLQSYGQKDPVIEYKKEARRYFEEFFSDLKNRVGKYLHFLDSEFYKKMLYGNTEMEKMAEKAIKNSGKTDENTKKEPVKSDKKVGRNDPCPCGSGKKYKNCCGKNL